MGKVLHKYSLGISFFQFIAFVTPVLNSHKGWSVAGLGLAIRAACEDNFYFAYTMNGNLKTHAECCHLTEITPSDTKSSAEIMCE